MIRKIINNYQKFMESLQLYCLNIAVMAAIICVLIFLGSTSFLYMKAPATIEHRKKLEEYFRQENARQDWDRLYRYHGYPHGVIYEEGKIPYFFDKWGRKCKFVYPVGEGNPVTRQTDFAVRDEDRVIKEHKSIIMHDEEERAL